MILFSNVLSLKPHEIGKENAEQEYQKFKENKQKNISEGDFEKAIKKIENKKRK